MATLGELKTDLKAAALSSEREALSQTQYQAGFDILRNDTTIYEDFIHPQLCSLLARSRGSLSVLEIGPGPKTVLAALPEDLRCRITKYSAFEPNITYASLLENRLRLEADIDPVLPYLRGTATVYRSSFSTVDDNANIDSDLTDANFDIILFCHSMYGMSPKRSYIEKALGLLKSSSDAMVIVFHRHENLNFDGLACQQTASFPMGLARLPDEDTAIDSFASFVAGTSLQATASGDKIRKEWRNICRFLGHKDQSGYLLFNTLEFMVTFTHGSTRVGELEANISRAQPSKIKNPEARLCHPASIVKPVDVGQVQNCVKWALKHRLNLAVVGGSHSGHCILDNVVSVDMSAFDQTAICRNMEDAVSSPKALIVVGAGATAGEIVRQTMEEELSVSLGSRPSVGAGLWLQGGIGHLSRQHGLTCDTIVGAVLVSVVDAQVLVVGEVPDPYPPHEAVRPKDESELLWALRGAGTNFGIVVCVVLKAFPASKSLITNWEVPVSGEAVAQQTIGSVNQFAADLHMRNSVDMYLYSDDSRQLRLGVTAYHATSSQNLMSATVTPTMSMLRAILGQEANSQVVDGVEAFNSEMYMSGMHGGHGGGKTSAFKRCVFLRDVGSSELVNALTSAVTSRSGPLCYLNLLQGGKAVSFPRCDATVFGRRDWDYACVITGVWKRNEDGTAAARAAVDWVYGVVNKLLPLSSGVYGADLGPDPRDANLAAHAFGLDRSRLGRLKSKLDPHNVLAYACPVPKAPARPKLVILVTGQHGTGKDYCAATWCEVLNGKGCLARTTSISDVTKREYAASTDASHDRLLHDRAYKEEHRTALTAFYANQIERRPDLPSEHFLRVINDNASVDVLFITGMRDDSPVASLSCLAPYSRVLEVHVSASKGTIRTRVGTLDQIKRDADLPKIQCQPDFVFVNDTKGDETAKKFAESHLLSFIHRDLTRLSDMVRSVPNFPTAEVEFHHILNIHDWTKVDLIASCESGGVPFGSALAKQLNLPLALICKADKLPPPTFSVTRSASYISSFTDEAVEKKSFEIDRHTVAKSSVIVVVDDVLSSGQTLCAVLQLLQKAGVKAKDVVVMVVAEFPVHRGRELLCKSGFGEAVVRSLLVYGGT
ncbi:hypothetical protein DOTSEDRAFT_36452 [Dothistroma septosporum NZE10]|uniref:FAD-binding PCMH-type domain-containing protein n=1 Tax=Dothistroma septosporum (strain NZE10 / CBS 128990) TaxID=675120 RepID=N1PKJ0_DOTSN|nr:hypothetical protein DOTSEDRAFT_36452 [Dothistroma septosporum NZE10]